MGERAEIVVFWRPGCGFCAGLFRRLDALAVPYRRVNIWDDPDAAAVVRRHAGGNETVPTVLVGSVALVNPGIDRLLGVAVAEVPDAVPAGWQPRQPNRLVRWVQTRLAGGDDRRDG